MTAQLPKRVARAAGISDDLARATVVPQNRSTFALHNLNALPAVERRVEVIKGLLAPGEIAALVGPPGKGKSAILQHLMTCVAEGAPFFGRDVLTGPVIYIAAERFAETCRRLLAIRQTSSQFYVSRDRPNLSKLSEVLGLVQVIKTLSVGPVLIAIDTFARCIPGSEENAARDMGVVIENLTQLMEQVPTAAVIFVHHTNKGGGDMRGSTALLGAVDLELAVKAGGDDKRQLTVTKANAVSEDQIFAFQLKPIKAAAGQTVISVVEAESEDEDPAPETGPSRAERVLNVVQELAVEGRADRRACLEQVRSAGIIVGKSPDSTSEQLRKVLNELRDQRQITFDGKSVWLGHPG
ncbi:MAG: helicase RepA family protein [Xanthobacteraceae bacterium]|nr:helicase RepA family protein [Xanthobacteraceae bacterium]